MLYYITDRTAFPGDETARRRQLIEKIAEAARAGVDYIQLREKDLAPRELEQLAHQAVNAIREARQSAAHGRKTATALLINSRTDVALAAGASGVHLRSEDVTPHEVKAVWQRSSVPSGAGDPFDRQTARENLPRDPIVAVSCHSPAEVAQAAASGADFAVFAPVYEKKNVRQKGVPGTIPAGLSALKEACRAGIPVLALGGITLENAQSCLNAGAAGIAAIRLFQENDVAEVASTLRALHS